MFIDSKEDLARDAFALEKGRRIADMRKLIIEAKKLQAERLKIHVQILVYPLLAGAGILTAVSAYLSTG
ncbi:hypothetical protein SFA35_21995 [Pseudomonas sp. HR96]|uniref:hypothetical protein n=1 Tax=Pseudomonas sp. HR96 TaxID=1027966 RepID=UPI002A75D79B|nr:hypothetical protein [Pseudomonas sp. HR96]WPO99246.1 hypothetical protein SFA35_21995 [Pseudomonas sp. HR96]